MTENAFKRNSSTDWRMQTRNETYEQIISMLLVAFEAPPLPLMALRGECNRDAVVSSHDLLYTMLNVHLNRCTVLSTEQATHMINSRTDLQVLARQRADAALSTVAPDDVGRMYEIFSDFTRQHLQTYADTHALDARFMPMDEVCPDTPVHIATMSHLAAALSARGIHDSFDSAHERLIGLRYTQLIRMYAELLWSA
jgi:hypothetical protein